MRDRREQESHTLKTSVEEYDAGYIRRKEVVTNRSGKIVRTTFEYRQGLGPIAIVIRDEVQELELMYEVLSETVEMTSGGLVTYLTILSSALNGKPVKQYWKVHDGARADYGAQGYIELKRAWDRKDGGFYFDDGKKIPFKEVKDIWFWNQSFEQHQPQSQILLPDPATDNE